MTELSKQDKQKCWSKIEEDMNNVAFSEFSFSILYPSSCGGAIFG